MKKLLPIILILSALLFSSCVKQKEKREFFAMDTHMTVTIYGPTADVVAADAQSEVERLDALFNAENEDSEIGRLNKSRAASLSEDTRRLLKLALEYSGETDGAFDPTVRPLVRLWGFTSGDYRVPSSSEIASALALVDHDAVSVTDNEAKITRKGVEIDLGGIAKGYTSDALTEMLSTEGIRGAIVDLGGNIQTFGKKPDGSDWKVAVKDPDGDGSLCTLTVGEKAVVTSGGYERYFTENDKTYCHIIDPESGRPVENDLSSVTIVADSGALADALSTALFVMGREKAEEFWKSSSLDFDFLLYTTDKKLYVSEGIADSVSDGLDFETVAR